MPVIYVAPKAFQIQLIGGFRILDVKQLEYDT